MHSWLPLLILSSNQRICRKGGKFQADPPVRLTVLSTSANCSIKSARENLTRGYESAPNNLGCSASFFLSWTIFDKGQPQAILRPMLGSAPIPALWHSSHDTNRSCIRVSSDLAALLPPRPYIPLLLRLGLLCATALVIAMRQPSCPKLWGKRGNAPLSHFSAISRATRFSKPKNQVWPKLSNTTQKKKEKNQDWENQGIRTSWAIMIYWTVCITFQFSICGESTFTILITP